MKIRKLLFLSLIIFTILLIPKVVNAVETTDTNGITWVYDLQNGQATNIKPKDKSTLPAELTIPSKLDGYPVISIGEEAFYLCQLTSVVIPNSVITLEREAFGNCVSLTSITIPNSVTTIARRAFSHCVDLTNITIPNSVTTLGDSVFYGCESLTSVTLPSLITTLSNRMFYNCTSLTSVTIPNLVTTIEEKAFVNCSALETVSIPASVTIIGDDVFEYCNLSTLAIEGYPGSVIKDYADFYDIEFKPIYKVTNKLTNLTNSNESFENDYTAILRADAGFILPQSILVKIADTELGADKYTYNSTTGEITIPTKQIVTDITIEASTNEQFKVNFDSNGGKFSNDEEILILENWENESDYFEKMDNVEEPIKEGYKFLGYYTEKEDGTSFKHLMAEVGIDKETTFYAQWKMIEKIDFVGNTEKQEFIVGEDEALAFILNSDRMNGKVLVDGVALSETNGDYSWEFAEGTFPYIELSKNYIKTLKVGTYTIKFVLDNGNEAETTFTIVGKVIEENKEEQKQENEIEKNEPSKELDESPNMGNNEQNLKTNIALVLIVFSIFVGLKIYNKKKI